MFNTLIKEGRIVNGTGHPWFRGAIGIKEDRIKVLRGEVSAVRAETVIDATGKVVCPGFIDTHAHSDLMALAKPLHEPKIMQGITSELVGVDGMGYAPLSKGNLEMMKLYWSGISGNPKIDVEWSSVSEYLRCFHHTTSVNIGFLIPNGAVRLEVIGWDDRVATQREINQMQGIVRNGMEEGALGLSSGLSYTPSIWANTNELVELCKVVAEFGGVYATHVRYDKGDGKFDGFKEAVEIGRRSGVAVSISHFFCSLKTRGRPEKLLEIIDDARQGGVDVTFDSYPYELGSSQLNTPIIIPAWAHRGGPYALLERLKSNAERAKMKEDNRDIWDDWEDWNHRRYISGVASEKNKWCEGLTIQEIADKLDKDIMDTICDLLIDEHLQVTWSHSRQSPRDKEDTMTIMQHPAGMICSDAMLLGEKCNPRVYGAFPKVIRWLVREEKVLTLEEAVSKMTSLPAQQYALSDRGILKDDMKADIVIFDPENISDKSTVAEPKRYPVGIEYVIVNGELTVEKGKHMGVLNGEPLTKGNIK